MTKQFCKLVVCVVLGLGSMIGMPMPAEKIQELMRTMNEPVIETTIPDESDKDDPLKKELRERGIKFD